MSDDDVASTKARDILIPVDTDKSNITCDDNDAHILGALYDVSRYYKRVGLFQNLLTNRSVLVGSKIAVDSVSAIPFIKGRRSSPHAPSPCGQ